eukprot:scpid107949/ scgid34917/ 
MCLSESRGFFCRACPRTRFLSGCGALSLPNRFSSLLLSSLMAMRMLLILGVRRREVQLWRRQPGRPSTQHADSRFTVMFLLIALQVFAIVPPSSATPRMFMCNHQTYIVASDQDQQLTYSAATKACRDVQGEQF